MVQRAQGACGRGANHGTRPGVPEFNRRQVPSRDPAGVEEMVSSSQEAKKNPSGEPRPSAGRRLRRFLTAHTDEWVLLGLAMFLFIVATNTQTGWLYVVVALLVGVLIVGFLGPRATLKGLEVRRRLPAP